MKQNNNNIQAKTNKKQLGFLEVLAQAFSLIFALQNQAGRKRLMDLAETNPMPVLFSGLSAMIIFFLFCLITSQIVIKVVTG